MSDLRERCSQMLDQLKRDAMLRQGSPVDDLTAFVVAEIGRANEESLSKSLPLCLYFATQEDREEFIEVFKEAKPNVITKKLP